MSVPTARRLIYIITAALLSCAVIWFVGTGDGGENTAVAASRMEAEDVDFEQIDPDVCASGVNAMAFELWDALEHPSNAAISPISISLTMSMLLVGARGETAEELAQVLHFSNSEQVHRCWAGMLDHWDDIKAADGVQFDVANGLFAEQSVSFRQDYVDLTARWYRSTPQPMDFRNHPESARRQINRWVEDATREQIEELLEVGAVRNETNLVAANAVFLSARWAERFDPDHTQEVTFRRADGTNTRVSMMNKTDDFPYAETDGVQLIELSYDGDELSMVVALPESRDGLTELEQRLDATTFDRWMSELSSTEVQVALPRFTIEGNSVDLGEGFRTLGVEQLFGDADLSGITEERLFVDSILHQTFVEVDEEGTEAAAATAVAAIGGTASPPEFRADRPFLFLIRDTTTGTLLFLGRVGDP